jgi:hypothetical protein
MLAEKQRNLIKEAISMARVIAALLSLVALVLAGGANMTWK